MKLRDWLEQWGMSSLKVKAGIMEMEFEPRDPDRRAAWELYVELLTRVATQPLAEFDGDEKTALESIYRLFPLTRDILRAHYGADQFAKVSVIVLNQIIRPFTAKWHHLVLAGELDKGERSKEFRSELVALRNRLCKYTEMLADMAAVESLVGLQTEL
jgi:hypothetical protein